MDYRFRALLRSRCFGPVAFREEICRVARIVIWRFMCLGSYASKINEPPAEVFKQGEQSVE